MASIQEIEARLIGQGYARTLFRDLEGQKVRGSEVEATCPFCLKPGKFYYSLEKPVCKCMIASCSANQGLNWYQYAEQRLGWSFQEYAQELAQAAGLELSGFDQRSYQDYQQKADVLEAAQRYFAEALRAPQTAAEQAVQEYLITRGYTLEEVLSMGLGAYTDQAALVAVLEQQGYSRQDIASAGLFSAGFGQSHTLTLLWRDLSGRPLGLVARSLDNRKDKYHYAKDLPKRFALLGLERARRAEQAILVEGVMDALYLVAHGLPVVAAGGADLSADQVKALEAAGVKELLIAFDQDDNGQDGTLRTIDRLLLSGSAVRPYIVSWIEDYKDPDELVRALGPEQGLAYFDSCLREAEGWPAWQVRHIAGRYALHTDRGLDAALEALLSRYVGITDSLEAKAYLQAISDRLELSQEDLAGRIVDYKRQQQEQKTAAKLQQLQFELADKAKDGDIRGAEETLEAGLQGLRRLRGAKAPEPYLITDFEQDLATMTDGLQTGYESLREVLTIPEGAITIIAGRPGHGKTTLMLNLLINLLRQYGRDKRFYFYSYEEAQKWLTLKLIMILAGERLHDRQNQRAYLNYFKEKRQTEPNQAIEKAAALFEKLTSSGRLWLQDQPLPAEDLVASIDELATRGDAGAVIVDYIQKVPVREDRPTRQLEVARASELLREVAVRHNLPIIVGAQFNRASQGRQDKRPQLSELREAGDLEQDANLVISLYNEAKDKQEEDQAEQPLKVGLELHVLKYRAGQAGGRHDLTFDQPTLRIMDKQKGKHATW